VRPKNPRTVGAIPKVTYFKPAGIPLKMLEEVGLSVEEAEALRLKDIEGLEQEQCAGKMNISRPTFQRVLSSARKKVAEALLGGKAIRIEGGNFELVTERGATVTSGRQAGKCGRGGGRMQSGKAGGPVGNCVCPNCGNRTPHQRGVPCYQINCPNCGAKMTRE
jgi:hypothetical protein